MILVEEAAVGIYKLKRGLTYIVFGNVVESAGGTPGKRSLQEDGSSRTPSKRNWDGIQNDPNHVSAYEACLRIEGTSELSQLYLASFEHRQVDHLPEDYDGNVIFELPPSTQADLSKKGVGLVGMNRTHDCWLWTKSVTTSAQIGGKKSLYAVNKIRCVGSLRCVNECCPYFLSEGQANRIVWPDKVHCDKPYQEGSLLPYKYHVCGHCGSPPLCDMTCPAHMYYVIPKGKVDIEEVKKMSRVAIHVGNHIHPPRRICSRRNFNSVKEVIAEIIHSSPHFTPGQKAFDTAVRLTEPLKDIQFTINGDITTKLHKRRGFATATINEADTHRHDRVVVTSQVVRRSKTRLSFDFLAPSTSMPTSTVTGPSLPTAVEKSTGFTPLDP
ncbi:hypothetical protein R1sor_026658 [Riccia sorocarpa]|uniref:Uncharacterized protein n=1 Tax=Riccia sorocarpa TaxID=122646 RepID=A0ABD3GC27_9MARC